MTTANNSAADVEGTPAETIEHRLALVMNGGVSLAVWMGGVACEIDLATFPPCVQRHPAARRRDK